MPESLESLAQQRRRITGQIAGLGDLRCGSITSTTGRCGKPSCHCHQPHHPGHGPNLRLTYKVQGKTVTESLPNPAAVRKAEREIEEFRSYQALHKEFIEVNARMCQLRPAESDTLSAQEKNARCDPAGNRSRSKLSHRKDLCRPPQERDRRSGSLCAEARVSAGD